MKEIKKSGIKHETGKTAKSKDAKPKSSKTKKYENPDSAHWVKSQAKLMKILEAAGMAPKSHKMMITCERDR